MASGIRHLVYVRCLRLVNSPFLEAKSQYHYSIYNAIYPSSLHFPFALRPHLHFHCIMHSLRFTSLVVSTLNINAIAWTNRAPTHITGRFIDFDILNSADLNSDKQCPRT